MKTTRSRMNKNARESAKKRKFLSSFNAETSAVTKEEKHEHEWEYKTNDQESEYYQCSCGATKTVTTHIEEPPNDDFCESCGFEPKAGNGPFPDQCEACNNWEKENYDMVRSL